MRLTSFIPAAAMALLVSGAAYGQAAWGEFVDREEHFTINLPGDPKVEPTTYKTQKGTSLPAKVYSAQDARGTYKVTVVNYATAAAETPTAIEEASKVIRAKGEVKYDAQENIDRIKDQRISLVLPGNTRRLLTEVMLHQNRLYITEAETPVNAPPPGQFQASIQMLDDDGVRIRYNPDGVTRQR
ncbi:MAG TPA: hypothetical protein VK479_16005 [Micropepsaceae bacterium]|nr:hypothetical protein [Micropepsaceae bacterium]